ncbi:hypothetical protein C1646_699183 [Rhizophagus diaphanus]|nr:hypothetical protein C1646_699183 [Rhizophagus diaphanus] [Rhizophagus sp. MUCL 43196]
MGERDGLITLRNYFMIFSFALVLNVLLLSFFFSLLVISLSLAFVVSFSFLVFTLF